jgi:hypothetical protein
VKRILIDLDGVVVDLMGEAMERGYFDHWPCRWNFPGCCTTMLMDDVFAGDIFRGALPIKGAVRGVESLIDLGYDVQFVSTPWPTNHDSAADKYGWVEEWFGPSMVRKTTLTHDKTLIPAAALIDDKPDLVGPWQHVEYPQAWNSAINPTWADGLASVVVGIVGSPATATIKASTP